MELWDIYDVHRNKTGATIKRGEPLQTGQYHLVVHVCIFNAQGEMLIQQRQPFKQGWSNFWDVTVGGSATAGDTSQTAAARELFEELGIAYDFSACRPNFTNNFANGFDDFYLVNVDVDLYKVHLQYEEVQAVKWASKEEIHAMIREGSFIPYYESLIQLIFDSRHRLGSRQV